MAKQLMPKRSLENVGLGLTGACVLPACGLAALAATPARASALMSALALLAPRHESLVPRNSPTR